LNFIKNSANTKRVNNQFIKNNKPLQLLPEGDTTMNKTFLCNLLFIAMRIMTAPGKLKINSLVPKQSLIFLAG